MTTPPKLSPQHRARAQERAVAARRLRAEIKERVRSGRSSPQQVVDLAFEDSDAGRAAARMTIGDLVLCLPGLGEVGADRLLVGLGINGGRRLRALGERQRAALRATWAPEPPGSAGAPA